jgi:hypothetical protein
MNRNVPKPLSPVSSLQRDVEDKAAIIDVQMLRLQKPLDDDRIISSDTIDFEEGALNSVRSYTDSCRNSSSSSGRVGSVDNFERVDSIPLYEKRTVPSRQRSATLASNSGEVGLSMNRPLRNRVSSAGRADRASSDVFRLKKSPLNVSGKETDSSSGIEESNIADRPRKMGPVFKYGNRSLKDESWRKEHRSAEHKPKLTDSVTKRQKHTSADSKSGNKNGNSRPISMSLAKRKSVVSNRFDTDTLALLGSLNLINLNDPEKSEYEDEIPAKSYYSPNGQSNMDDVISDSDYDNRMSYLSVGSLEYHDKAQHSGDESEDIHRGGTLISTAEKNIHSNFGIMDVIYEENAPYMGHIREKSPYYFSTNNSPVNPKVKLIELKPKKQMRASIQKHYPSAENSPTPASTSTSTSTRDISGLLEGDGLLEFCTVDADLCLFLKSKEEIIVEDENKLSKKSIYDIKESEINEAENKKKNLLASYSTFITPKKSHSLPAQNFSIEHIHDFCFPSGIRVDFLDSDYAELITKSSGRKLFLFYFILCYSTLFYFD